MSAHDRYVLAIALLDGDREARKILADLLEEQGDRGLAQWARGGGNARHRRLEFALMLLPCRDGIRLALEFMQHVFTSQADVKYIERTSLVMTKWESEQTSNEDLQVYCEITLQRFGIHPPTTQSQHTIRRATARNLAFNHLLEALRCAVRAAQNEAREVIGGTPRHWQTTAQHYLRAIASACQNQAKPKWMPAGITPPPAETDWQIQRTKELFQRLLESAS